MGKEHPDSFSDCLGFLNTRFDHNKQLQIRIQRLLNSMGQQNAGSIMFIIPSTTIHRCLKHEGVIGQGKDFLTDTPCLLHLYTFQGKYKFGLQTYQHVTRQFAEYKIQQLSKTFLDHSSPNICRVMGFSKYCHSNKLFDLSILYDLGSSYGVSLENIIANKIKNNIVFKQTEVLDFLVQMFDVIINTSAHTSEYLQLTPINIFAAMEPKHGYSFFPNNFGLSFAGTEWDKPYFNPTDMFHHSNSCQNGISSMMFVIGMIALEMCTLQESSMLYQNGEINEKILYRSLESIKLTFSSSLFELISRLCALKQSERIKIDEIYSQDSFLSKHRQGTLQKLQVNGNDFEGLVLNNVPQGTCKVSNNLTTYTGSLDHNYKYQGFGILTTQTQLYRGQFTNNQFRLGEYFIPDQFLLFGSVDNKGHTNGFKIALSGNKEFLYQSGIFNHQKQLIKGKSVLYNGKTTDVDPATRKEPSRLSGTSINLPKLH